MTTHNEDDKYTLDEAQRLLALEECSAYGHSFDIESTLSGPATCICRKCGWQGVVMMGPLP